MWVYSFLMRREGITVITETDAKTASVIRRKDAQEKEVQAHADAADEFIVKRFVMTHAPFPFLYGLYFNVFRHIRQLWVFEKFVNSIYEISSYFDKSTKTVSA